MYKIKDVVMYGDEGVCIISDIVVREFKGEHIRYFVLKPVTNNSTTIYIPVNNKELVIRMKKVLSKEEVVELIKSMPQLDEEWIKSDNLRKDKYKEVLKSGNREELVCMIKNLCSHSLKMKEEGKKFHICDERMMKDAKKKLYEEFSYVLDIEFDEVVKYIEGVNEELVKK